MRKRHFATYGALGLAAALAACTSTQTANLNAAIANLNATNLVALQTINNGCKIVQPALTVAGQVDAQVAAVATVNGTVCATAAAAASAASAVVAAEASGVAAGVAIAPAASTPLSTAAPIQ